MTTFSKSIARTLAAIAIATAGAAGVQAQTAMPYAGEQPRASDFDARPTVGTPADRAAVHQAAVEAIANGRLRDAPVFAAQPAQTGASLTREQVHQKAVRAVKDGTLSVG
ncbi:hypothetical protein AAV94_03735 [Lampropedia cohaerens]|uniref:DUF4148 domain-containing protein n=1 Tax=Lampropedia cohaerens TaxID=1610491 RepID=A0A0U1Q1N1_9BURK|nr:hypothetical protein [Lampropedia cohaerens]KKW68650.1 hypothetical protein AAV94_03735 [Lampropedia cohaerens]